MTEVCQVTSTTSVGVLMPFSTSGRGDDAWSGQACARTAVGDDGATDGEAHHPGSGVDSHSEMVAVTFDRVAAVQTDANLRREARIAMCSEALLDADRCLNRGDGVVEGGEEAVAFVLTILPPWSRTTSREQSVVGAQHLVPFGFAHRLGECRGPFDVSEHERLLDASTPRRVSARRPRDQRASPRFAADRVLRRALRTPTTLLAARVSRPAGPRVPQGVREAETGNRRFVGHAGAPPRRDPTTHGPNSGVVVSVCRPNRSLGAYARSAVRLGSEHGRDARQLPASILGGADIAGTEVDCLRGVEDPRAQRAVAAHLVERDRSLRRRGRRRLARVAARRTPGGVDTPSRRDGESLLGAVEIADAKPNLTDLGPSPSHVPPEDVLAAPEASLCLGAGPGSVCLQDAGTVKMTLRREIDAVRDHDPIAAPSSRWTSTQ